MIVECPRYLPGIHATKRQKGERRGWIAAVQFSFLIITVRCALCCPVLCTVCVRVIYLMFAPSTQHPAPSSSQQGGDQSVIRSIGETMCVVLHDRWKKSSGSLGGRRFSMSTRLPHARLEPPA
jgi:hypothetical protein